MKTKQRYLCPSTSLNKLNHLLRPFQSQSTLCFNGFIITQNHNKKEGKTNKQKNTTLQVYRGAADILPLLHHRNTRHKTSSSFPSEWNDAAGMSPFSTLTLHIRESTAATVNSSFLPFLRFIKPWQSQHAQVHTQVAETKGFFPPPLPPLIIFHWQNTELGAIRS